METDTEVAPLVKYYEKIARHLQERPAVAEKEAATLLKRACAHAQHRDVDLSRTALTVLGVLLHRRAPPAELATEVSGWLLPLLHQLLRQPAVEARRPLVRALWCLEALVGAGHLPEERPEPLAQLVRTLLRAGMPSAVQIRAVTLVRRVAGSPAAGPTALVPLVRLLWPVLLRSTMPAVATEAEETVRACMAVAGVQAAFTGELLAMATSGGYLAQLQEAVTRPECGAQALTAWALLVDCLGARLQSTALINQVLQVIQAPFRSNNNELRRRSFVAWRSMVNNFLASGRLHENPKRLKLLITPLTQGNTGRPAVAVEKFRVWWTLLAGLGPHLSATFDTTTEPFLRFCFVPADKGLANGGGGGARDRVGGVVLQLADARPLARAALIQLLSPGCRQFAAESVAAREHEAVTGAVFARHAALLADSAAACLLRAPADGLAEVLLEPLLDWTTRHLESQASLGLTREQGLPVTAVLRALDTLLAAQLESPVAEQVVIVADRLVARLPERFVWSSLHQMEGAGGPPALFLLRSLGRRPSGEPSGGAALSRLVRALGADALRRLPELVALLSGAELAEELRPLVWHDTAETLLEHIEKTQEVDSGDALGHDFGPVSALLAAPLSWPPPAAGPHLHTWSRLYCAARVAAELVATAPPNALAAEVAGRLRAAAPLAVPAAAHCLRVMAETALLKETDGAPRSGTGSPLKRRGPSPSDASAAVLEATVPQLAPLLLLLADLCSQLEEHATPEAVADLAESVRRLSGAHVAAAPATAVLVQTLGAATASLLQVAAPNSPVRNKVLSAYEAVVGLVRQRLSELSPTAVLAQLAPLLEAAPAAEPSRRLWHAVLAPRRPAVPEHLAPLLPRRRLMEALSAEKERRQRAAASPNKTAMSPGRPPPPAAPPSPARGGKEDTFVVIPPSPAGPRPLTEHQREVRAAPRDSIPALRRSCPAGLRGAYGPEGCGSRCRGRRARRRRGPPAQSPPVD
ncbi:telomere-associated protein RIF1-like [Amphibalanus amphitrite]|uniref:telomere-associated protein RIF1-like n=1 Tax=Amphibalanus amphitrite TaxID=1232801 RepID=UPI001C9062C5|nr:telomere-associated protein RIF1-like [Amphibalanus amphitrite]